jgi:hypothetical protein
MTAFNNSALSSMFNADGARVRAWCFAGMAYQGVNIVEGNLRDQNTSFHLENGPCNHINGYNLTFDDPNYRGILVRNSPDQAGTLDNQSWSVGGIPMKFVTPLEDNKYKVFVQIKTIGGYPGRGLFAHCLNSAAYPKTTTGFWVRWGLLLNQTEATGSTVNMNGRGASPAVLPPAGKILTVGLSAFSYQLQVVVI